MNLEIVYRGTKPLGSKPGGRLELVHSHEHAGHAKLTEEMAMELGLPFKADSRFRTHPIWIHILTPQVLLKLNMTIFADPFMRTDEIHVEENKTGKTLAVLRGLCDCGKAKNR